MMSVKTRAAGCTILRTSASKLGFEAAWQKTSQLITWVTSPKSDGGKFARSLKSPHHREMSYRTSLLASSKFIWFCSGEMLKEMTLQPKVWAISWDNPPCPDPRSKTTDLWSPAAPDPVTLKERRSCFLRIQTHHPSRS